MANIPLKSIKFPGLSDTYTIPQIDNTLTQEGQAADAEATGAALKQVAETTKNLITGKISEASISSAGKINTSSNTDIVYAPVVQGETYALTTDEANVVYAFYNSTPAKSSVAYDNARTVTTNIIVTAPITGYIAVRTLTGYEYPQIEAGTEKTYYMPPVTAVDSVARHSITEVTANLNAVAEDVDKLTLNSASVQPVTLYDETGNLTNPSYYDSTKFYTFASVNAGDYLQEISLISDAGDVGQLAIIYGSETSYTLEHVFTLNTGAADEYVKTVLNYVVEHDGYIAIGKHFYFQAGGTNVPILFNISTNNTITNVSPGSSGLIYDLKLIKNSEINTSIKGLQDTLLKTSKITDVDMYASDIAMFENVGFCGDSYMAGMIVLSENPTVTAENRNLCWGKILERTHGINAFIYAKGGITTSGYASDSDCLPKLLTDSAKQLYVISLGHNDAFNETPVEDFKTSYRAVLDAIINHANGAKIILCRQSKGYGNYRNGAELNAAISELGTEYGVPVLDPEDDIYLSSDEYVQTQIHRHPTFAGYAGMAKAFDRLFSKATVDYWDYFKGYTGL